MRITETILFRELLRSLAENREQLGVRNQRMATGEKLRHPSDDPTAYLKYTAYRRIQRSLQDYQQNVEDGLNWTQTTSNLLDQIHDALNAAHDVAIQAADATIDASSRAALAERVDGLIRQIISIATSRFIGKNLFAGTKTDISEVFTYDGSSVTYNGNDGSLTRAVSKSVTLQINVTGQELIDAGVFSSLLDLKNALENNDEDAIRTAIDDIQNAGDEVLAINGRIGSIQKNLNSAKNHLEIVSNHLEELISKVKDVDMASEITRYNLEEISYRAAMQATSELLNLNILNYLR